MSMLAKPPDSCRKVSEHRVSLRVLVSVDMFYSVDKFTANLPLLGFNSFLKPPCLFLDFPRDI